MGAIESSLSSLKTSYGNQALTAGVRTPFEQGISTFSTITSGISSLANIYTGFQQLSMAKDQLAMQKKQFEESMKELNRVKAVSRRLTRAFG